MGIFGFQIQRPHRFHRQPLPQQAHHGIFPFDCPCDEMDIFRCDFCCDDDRWLKLVDDSLDDAKLLLVRSEISVPVSP